MHGDVVRLKQIAWNLLSNPLKFTPAGGKAWVRLAEEGEMAHIEVADSGKGIASEHLPVIFKLFRQGDTGTTRKYGGTGIGLALVRELTRSHGGRVGATSEGEGRGAQFHVWLPLAAGHHGATDMMPEVQASLAENAEAYALIISDIGMPGMDGYTLLAALRAQAATASTPAIALSGFTRPRDVQQALDAGFETHACKPIVLEQFLRMASRIAK